MSDPRWKEVADLQAKAWKDLAAQNPDYESRDVEQTHAWQQARALADKIMDEDG